MLVDTGATKTIVRRGVARKRKMSPSRWRLRTATGEAAKVHGEVDVRIQFGSTHVSHPALVADIEEDVILGMDIMDTYGFQLDLKRRVIHVGAEELILHQRETAVAEVMIAEDVELPARCESIAVARLNGSIQDGIPAMVEPRNHDQELGRGILVGKALIKSAASVPVRLININDHPVTLKKGTQVGTLEPITAVIHQVCAEEGRKPDKLGQILAAVGPSLSQQERKKVRDLVNRYRSILGSTDGRPGRTSIVRHKIDTGEARPIRQAARRLPQVKKEEAERTLQEMVKDGVVEPSSSPWASPVVLVKKKDGSTRFCVDYRRLNDVTKKDSYPLPRIDDALDALAGSKLFSTLDLKSGYWQVEMDPADKEKTAFTSGTGLWQFTVLPFGLCNAPATFERLMENILRGLSWKTCLVYLDDVIILGRTFDEHLLNLEEVFKRLRAANLTLNVKKCHLFQTKVSYLGHIVSGEGVAVDPDKIHVVQQWPAPSDKHQLRSFLGLCSYYRRYVKMFGDMAKPLTRLTEEGRSFSWDEECQEAFDTLKKQLTSTPILGYPLPEGKFILDTDASNVGIGAVLSQLQDGRERVLGYFSKTLSKPERNYCVTRRELLAVVKSVEHFYKYLYGRRFLIRTDHASLKWLLNFKNPEGQVARWMEKLQEYDFQIEHRPGVSHRNADALSRRPCQQNCSHCSRLEEKEAGLLQIKVVNEEWCQGRIQEQQESDPDLKRIREWMSANSRPTWQEVSSSSPSLKSYWAQWNSLLIEEGLLKRIVESADGTEAKRQLLVPKTCVPEILRQLHDGTSGGHLGVKKTLQKVRERFYWVSCSDDVRDWCRRCATCAASNGPQRKRRAGMQQYIVGSPFERIAVDVLGPLPESEAGKKYIFVVMDYFTKWVEAYAVANQEAATLADVLVKEFIGRFGVPLELHSDQGRNFESKLFQEVCQKLGIRKTRTTTLHPQSDGMVERMNRTLIRHLSKVVSDHQQDWDEHLPLFLMAYRSAVNESSGQTPSKVLFGREMRLPCDLVFGSKPGEDIAGEDYVSDLRRKMEDTHELVRTNLKLASDRMKKYYDSRAEESCYKEGDLVWLYNPRRRRGLCPKLQKSWEGPYVIKKKINDVVYRIYKAPRGKPIVVHSDRLAPFAGDHDKGVRIQRLQDEENSTFEDFMRKFGGTGRARYGIVREVEQDILQLPEEYSLVHSTSANFDIPHGLAKIFRDKYGREEDLKGRQPAVGSVLKLQDGQRVLFYLMTRRTFHQRPSYETLWNTLKQLKEQVLELNLSKLAMPKMDCSRNGLNWRTIRNMVEVIFKDTTVEILVCSFHLREPGRKTIPCYFHETSYCKEGPNCRYSHNLDGINSIPGGMPLKGGQCNGLAPRTGQYHGWPQ